LLDGISLCGALPTAAGISAFELVIGEDFDVIPPSLAIEVRSGLGRGRNHK
jgi:hypothetical protein